MATINYNYLTPEQALKTLDDYLQASKREEALSMLFRYLSTFGMRNRRAQYNDQQGDISVASNIQHLYKLMISYIDLRLEIGISQNDELNQLKEVFKSYRQMTQHHHTDAFFDVLAEYKSKVETLFNNQVKHYKIEDLQKLTLTEEPAEELLYLSFDPEAKQQRDQMKSCLRLIWEAYRTIMENVKWNEKMEAIYFEMLKRVSEFCLTYRRKAEFAWFTEQINKFVTDLNVRDIDLKKNPSHVDLSKSSTNDKHVTIRFDIVQIAMALEMWQEALKLLETILVLKNMRKGVFRTSYLLQFFDYLAQIFQKSQNSLYQAFAYYNHFLAYKKKPVTSPDEMKKKSEESSVKLNYLLISTLVIPLHQAPQENIQREKVSMLFGQGTKVPTREELLKILGEMNVLEFVTPIVRKVYNLLETEQDLLTVSENAQICFKELEQIKEYSGFVHLLEENLIAKILKNVSSVFKTIKLESLYNLLKFVTKERILQTLLYSNAHGLIDCKLDFVKGMIQFNQNTVSRDQQVLPTILAKLVQLSNTVAQPSQKVQEDVIEAARHQLESAGLTMVSRQQTIRKLNKQADPNLHKKEWNEARDQEKKELEKERRAEDERRRWEQEKTAEMELKKAKELAIRAKLVAEIIKFKGSKLVTLEIDGERKKIENLKEFHLLIIDTTVLQDIRKKFEEDSKKGADDKFMRAFKRADYLERERRNVELSKIQESWENHLDADILLKYEELHKQKHQQNLQLKQNLVQTKEYKEQRFNEITKKSESEYQLKLKEWKQSITLKFRDLILKRAEELKILDKEEKARKMAEEAELKKMREESEKSRMKEQHQQRADWRNAPGVNPNATDEAAAKANRANLSDQFAGQDLKRSTAAPQAAAADIKQAPGPAAPSKPAGVANEFIKRNEAPMVRPQPEKEEKKTSGVSFTNVRQGLSNTTTTNTNTTAPTTTPAAQQPPANTGLGISRNQQPQQQQQQQPQTTIQRPAQTQQQPQQQLGRTAVSTQQQPQQQQGGFRNAKPTAPTQQQSSGGLNRSTKQ